MVGKNFYHSRMFLSTSNIIFYSSIPIPDPVLQFKQGGFVLEQNYPNPFNPSTMIKFGTSKATPVVLKVYDILGNEIITLFNETAEADRVYEVEFNGNNLPSGVYIYSLQINERTYVQKMMLTK